MGEAGTRVSSPRQSKGAEGGRDGSDLRSGLPGEEESRPARPLRQSPDPSCLSLPLGVAALPSEFPAMPRALEERSPALPQLSGLCPFSILALLSGHPSLASFPSFPHRRGSGLLHLQDGNRNLPQAPGIALRLKCVIYEKIRSMRIAVHHIINYSMQQ